MLVNLSYNIPMQKTLVLGGSFDPPHAEHVNMVKSAMSELGIERLVIVPTFLPPYKSEGMLDFDARCELVKSAFDGINFVIDDVERVRGGDNYSALVLPILKEKYGDIVYLVGGDSLEHFESWYRPDLIVKCCPIAVCEREGFDSVKETANNLSKKLGGEFIVLGFQGKKVASSQIRVDLLLGEQPNGLDDNVFATICKNGYYNEYKWAVDRLKSYQTDELFAHSKAVVKMGVELNSRHNLKLDFEKVFLACLLHDNAKQRKSLDGLDVPDDAIDTPVLHQFLGARKAERDFGITDGDVLSAIECHTTAKGDMTLFEKLVYTADSLSRDRDYAPIPELREIALDDFEKGFLAVLEHTFDKLSKKRNGIYPLTLEAVKFYLNK